MIRVQFRFGDTSQRAYRLGDRVAWGGNDIRHPGLAQTSVLGAGEPCPKCGLETELDYAIEFVSDVLTGVQLLTPVESARLTTIEAERGW